jgi:hypothetical protein
MDESQSMRLNLGQVVAAVEGGTRPMISVVASDKLERVQVRGADDSSVRWNGAFVVYGGHGTTQSSTIVVQSILCAVGESSIPGVLA